MSKPDPIKALLQKATEPLKDAHVLCECGTTEQAVAQAEEILRTMDHGDCAIWVAGVAAALFTRAADHLQGMGIMGEQEIKKLFVFMATSSHVYGMSYRETAEHFNIEKAKPPRKDKS